MLFTLGKKTVNQLLPELHKLATDKITPIRISLVAQLVKNPPAMQETWVRSLGWEDPLEKGKGYPLQYSGLEDSTGSVVHGVVKSQT